MVFKKEQLETKCGTSIFSKKRQKQIMMHLIQYMMNLRIVVSQQGNEIFNLFKIRVAKKKQEAWQLICDEYK